MYLYQYYIFNILMVNIIIYFLIYHGKDGLLNTMLLKEPYINFNNPFLCKIK